MAQLLFANNATTTISGAITATALAVAVSAGSGVEFPAPIAGQYFVATFNDAATGLLTEIVWVTAVSGDTLTIVRAKEGTTALAWNAGDILSNLWTAGSAGQMLQIGVDAPDNFAVATLVVNTNPSSNAYTIAWNLTQTLYAQGNPQGLVYFPANTSINVTLTDGTKTAQVVKLNGQLPQIGYLTGYAQIFWDGTYWRIAEILSTDIYQRLTGATTINVNAATGSDTVAMPVLSTVWKTPQAAITWCQQNLDLSGYTLTIAVADGTYTTSISVTGQLKGQIGTSAFQIIGDVSTPASCVISTSGNCVSALSGAQFLLSGFTLTSSSGSGVLSNTGGAYINLGTIVFGACSFAHIYQSFGGIGILNNYSITGGATYHWYCNSGVLSTTGSTTSVTITGTPAFNTFVYGTLVAVIAASALTFSGTATGYRYAIHQNCVLNTLGGGTNYFPGSAAGTYDTGAEYI